MLYSNARAGTCRRTADGPDETLAPLFEEILRTVPPPAYDPAMPLQLLVTTLDYDDYVGRLAVGRLFNGRVRKAQEVGICRLDGEVSPAKVTVLYGYEGLRRTEIAEAGPGDIVAVAGLEEVAIGVTLSDLDDPRPLPPIQVDEPTITMVLSINDSPFSGREGKHVTLAQAQRSAWNASALINVSIRVEPTETADAFRVSGRGELQLAILIEMMRREGYEMSVGKPQAVTRTIDGRLHEPMELLVVDCPEEFIGVVTQCMGARRGRMMKMSNHGSGRVRIEFRVPSRGLIGFRTEFLTETCAAPASANHLFDGWEVWQGDIDHRATGALVADRQGRATAYSIENLQPRGSLFLAPGDEVYEGMVIGEHARGNDLDVNVTKEKKLSNMRASGSDDMIRLIPPRLINLEQALEFIPARTSWSR